MKCKEFPTLGLIPKSKWGCSWSLKGHLLVLSESMPMQCYCLVMTLVWLSVRRQSTDVELINASAFFFHHMVRAVTQWKSVSSALLVRLLGCWYRGNQDVRRSVCSAVLDTVPRVASFLSHCRRTANRSLLQDSRHICTSLVVGLTCPPFIGTSYKAPCFPVKPVSAQKSWLLFSCDTRLRWKCHEV